MLPIANETKCAICGMLHQQPAKRLRGTIYRQISQVEFRQVVAISKNANITLSQSFAAAGFENVQLKPADKGRFLCDRCFTTNPPPQCDLSVQLSLF